MLETLTSISQAETEALCQKNLSLGRATGEPLRTKKHVAFLRQNLGQLPAGMVSLDASKPWLVYWAVNGLSILGDDISDLSKGISETILSCQNEETGGLGGGYQQVAHLAPTYAGLLALAYVKDKDHVAWSEVRRLKPKYYRWLMSLKQPNGSFKTTEYGEADSRSTYCALVIASILGIMTNELRENTVEYLSNCQTYEGGFADAPGGEAHAGYAFCALAGLVLILGDPLLLYEHIDVDLAMRWLSVRQSSVEGGYSGRTNKLVDGCYDHWAGGCWAFLEAATGNSNTYDRKRLQEFILYCNQTLEPRGGLVDKPGCRPDAYHTNYVLCGLAGSQAEYRYENGRWITRSREVRDEMDMANQVNLIHPIFVVTVGVIEELMEYMHDTSVEELDS